MRRNECGVVGGGAAEELARQGMWRVSHVPWCASERAVRAVDCGVDVGRGARARCVYAVGWTCRFIFHYGLRIRSAVASLATQTRYSCNARERHPVKQA
jgi:hypothetical protein